MSQDNVVPQLLISIQNELEKQISDSKKDVEINMGKIIELSDELINSLNDSNLSSGSKQALIDFSHRSWVKQTSIDNLQIQLENAKDILKQFPLN
jgi:hypothetical protein